MVSEKTPLLQEPAGDNTTHKHGAISDGSSTSTSSDNNAGDIEKTTDSPDESKKWTRQQMLTAASLSLMNISLCISFGIISPFYPTEAAKKGATTTEVGLVFGVFQLIMFITAPVYGSFIQQIGAKYMFLSGAFILGGCSIAFGFLDKCPDGTVFVVMCFVSRSIEANGCSMLSTASFAIMAKTFPNNVGQAIGTLEIFSGIGMVLGPSIGGGLYGIGGYTLPFAVIGGLVWMTTIVSYFVLPPIDDIPKMSGSFLTLLKIPGCVVIYFVILGCGNALSFLDPTFSPWMIKTFPGITIPQVGLIFMIAPGVYALFAPVAGFIADKGFQGTMCWLGLILLGFSFLMFGPSPIFMGLIPTTLPVTIVALVIMGMMIGVSIIPVFPMAVQLARNRGLEDNIQTYGIVSGFFQSGFSLGAFVGPSAAGYLSGHLGFAWSCTICGFIMVFVGLLMLGYILFMKSRGEWPIPVPEGDDKDNKTENEQSNEGAINHSNDLPPPYGTING